jgi:hypothetical protein
MLAREHGTADCTANISDRQGTVRVRSKWYSRACVDDLSVTGGDMIRDKADTVRDFRRILALHRVGNSTVPAKTNTATCNLPPSKAI